MRLIKISLYLVMLLVITTGCIAIPTGDGGSIKLSKDGVSIKTADGEEASIKVDAKEGSLSFKGKDAEGKEIDYNLSTSNELPKQFPKDIPMPKAAKIVGSHSGSSDGSSVMIVSYEIKGKVSEYSKIYKDYLQKEGYADVEIMSENDDAETQIVTGRLGDRSFSATVLTSSDAGMVTVNLAHVEKSK